MTHYPLKHLSYIFLLKLVLLVPLVAQADQLVIDTGNGVQLKQVRYNFDTPQISNTGLLEADLISVRESTGMSSGYINMTIGSDWVVRNMIVPTENIYPYSRLAVEFDLGTSPNVAVTQLAGVTVTFSDEVVTGLSGVLSQPSTASLSLVNYSVGGIPSSPSAPPPTLPAPPNLTDILFGDPTNTDAITQFDHPNIEASVNQCMPASIANSLQFLEDTTDLEIPHDNVAGLKGDNSLVGQLDTHTGRTVLSRFSNGNSGTWGINGKLSYLAANGLQDRVQTTHMGNGANAGSANVSVSKEGNTASATGLGTAINFQTLLSSMKEGQDCELVYAWPGNAHAVDAVAAGLTNGQAWIVHGSDMDQSTDSAGGGPEGLRYANLKDTDGDGLLNLNGSNEQLVQVICEKYIPPPIDLTVTDIDDPAGHSCCVEAPPSQVAIVVDGSNITISGGNVPWLPMTGTIQANGNISLSSISTVASYSNVQSMITGTYNPLTRLVDNMVITLGSNGALPTTQAISYKASLSTSGGSSTAQARPVIRANGFRDLLQLNSGEPISLTLEMNARSNAGVSADWFVIRIYNDIPQYFNLTTGQFENGTSATYQGSLTDLPFTRLALLKEAMASGTYTYYFGVDTTVNGEVDIATLIYDSVEIEVR